jgi:hypothetical protein
MADIDEDKWAFIDAVVGSLMAARHPALIRELGANSEELLEIAAEKAIDEAEALWFARQKRRREERAMPYAVRRA